MAVPSAALFGVMAVPSVGVAVLSVVAAELSVGVAVLPVVAAMLFVLSVLFVASVVLSAALLLEALAELSDATAADRLLLFVALDELPLLLHDRRERDNPARSRGNAKGFLNNFIWKLII